MTIESSRSENLFYPVSICLSIYRILADDVPTCRKRASCLLIRVCTDTHFIFPTERLRKILGRGKTEHTIIFNRRFPRSSLLGRNENDTCRTGIGPINGGRSSIFQYCNWDNITHIERCSRYTINDIQGSFAVWRAHTANGNRWLWTRMTAISNYRYTGNLSLQHLWNIAYRTFLQLVYIVDSSHSSRKITLLGLSITNGYNFIKQRGIFLQCAINRSRLFNCVSQGFITDRRELECSPNRDAQFIISIEVSDCSVMSTKLSNRGIGNRITIAVNNTTSYTYLILLHNSRCSDIWNTSHYNRWEQKW